MIYDRSVFQGCVTSFDDLLFNGSVHIVKMAETKVSRLNGCKSVDNDQAALYTRLLFDYWRRNNKVIKMFDTCIKRIDVNCCGVTPYTAPIEVLFKDSHLEKDIRLGRIVSDECLNCTKRDICQSAVEDYKVLEYNNGKFYINLE